MQQKVHPKNGRKRRFCRGESLEARLAMTAGPLVITEVMYNPTAPTAAEDAAGWKESDFEFIELQNVGDQSLLLTNYALSNGAQFTFGAVTLGAGEFIVVAKIVAAFQLRHGVGINVVGAYGGTLSNGGDGLILTTSVGATTLNFAYDDAWYPSTDGNGNSLVIANPQAPFSTWGQAASWQPSSALGGSPGRAEGPVDPTPPAAPLALAGTAITSTRVDLTWLPAVDLESGVNSYRVYRDGKLLGTTTALTYSDLTALPNSNYNYQASATNPFGLESAHSNAATVIIAPLAGNPAFAAGQITGTVTGTDLSEASGLVVSRRNPGVLYTHNDGAKTALHMINSEAQFLGKLTLSGVSSVDWEDIAIGPGPVAGTNYVYVGDIGDNDSNRSMIAVHRFAEPALNASGGNQSMTLSSGQYTTLNLRYSDGSYDSETLLSDPLTGDLFVITKNLTTNRIYRATAAALAQGGTVTLNFVGSLNFDVPSGGEISPTGREILIRNEDVARLYLRAEGQSIAQAFAGTSFVVPVIGTPDEPNGEAIAFDAAGSGYYTISEDSSPPLYYFHRITRAPGQVDTAAVVGRHIFYNNSAFDARDPAAGASDDLAIASDKQALLPGTAASFANYTSYSRGINGIMVDIQNLSAASLTAADFRFQVGNNSAVGGWANAPAPTSIVVRSGAGSNGADRVELIWADRAISKTWLQVTVLANANTGLTAADTFYFGNAIADVGNSATNAVVNSVDEIAVRSNATGVSELATIFDPFDFDRDRHVNATDQILSRSNSTSLATALALINVPSAAVAQEPTGLLSQFGSPVAASLTSSNVTTTPVVSANPAIDSQGAAVRQSDNTRTLASAERAFLGQAVRHGNSPDAEDLFDLLARDKNRRTAQRRSGRIERNVTAPAQPSVWPTFDSSCSDRPVL